MCRDFNAKCEAERDAKQREFARRAIAAADKWEGFRARYWHRRALALKYANRGIA
jgi:hypothetical protein